MSQLTVIDDPLRGLRFDRTLRDGVSLASELMRLFPEGIEGPWRIYRDVVREETEIAVLELPNEMTSPVHWYLLVRGPGADPGTFLLRLALAFILAGIARTLQPKPRTYIPNAQDTQASPNNAIAGQSNVLRAGARVPELLGRVRAWPDLLTYATEDWIDLSQMKTQVIEEFFVVGVGDYDIEDPRLGDTPLGNVTGQSFTPYPPGSTVEPISVVVGSPAVDQISLNATASGAVASSLAFNAANKTLTSPNERLSVAARDFVTFSGTDSNDAGFYVALVPPTSQTSGPYVYTLEGPVVNESNTTPAYRVWPIKGNAGNAYCLTRYEGVENVVRVTGFLGAHVGDGYNLTIGANTWHGKVKGVTYIYSGSTPQFSVLTLGDFYGVNIVFPPGSSGTASIFRVYDELLPNEVTAARGSVRDGVTALADEAAWSGWFTAPLAAPDEVWIDISFPSGLTAYVNGNRQRIGIDVAIEFKRPNVPNAQDAKTMRFDAGDPSQLRYTKHFKVGTDIVLPPGEFVDVRMRRTTPLFVETATTQYVDDMRWHALRSMVLLEEQVYRDVYIIKVRITNTNSAMSVGQSSFNCIATRKQYTWTPGGGWSAQPQASRKWFPNIVQRMRADDGANKDDIDIDLAGMYAIQQRLDAIDTDAPYSSQNGAAGEISLTLDQSQDIDSELNEIADVARSQVYRVGRKLYCIRDQENATPTALFNGRAKSPDAESVAIRMTSDAENDAVIVSYVDALDRWNQREYIYPPPSGGTPINPARIAARLANWPQAYRRARFEWLKIQFRREVMSVDVTEDGRLCRPGDVILMTDDIANLSTAAGEVLSMSGLTLLLDREVIFGAGSHTIVLRGREGKSVDAIPCTAVAGSANRVTLSRAPIASIELKGRDLSRGTLFAFYSDSAATVRRWFLTKMEAKGPYVVLSAVNDTARVYEGDSESLPSRPQLRFA